MLYLTFTTITSVDLAHYGVSRAKDWVSVDCGTTAMIVVHVKVILFYFYQIFFSQDAEPEKMQL